jgi:hypothetical protein
VCFGLAAAPALRLRIGGFFSSPGQPRPKMIQACADCVRELAGVRLSGSRQQAMRYFEHFGRCFGHLGIRCKPRSAPQVNFFGWRWHRPEAELTDMQSKVSNGGCYRPIDSPAAQVATERHSRNLPPTVDPAATPLLRYAFSILQVGVVPVTAGPGNQDAADAVARGHLRASHADREDSIHMLKAAFVQGMLTKAELDARLGQTFAARTHGELAALTADLPAGLADAVPPRRAARAQTRPPMSNPAKAGISVVIAVAVAVIVSIPTGGAALFLFAPFYFLALLVAGAQILASRHEKRSRRGQLPPRPA